MGVYIPNMDKPKSCVKCHWYYELYDERCTLGKFLLRKYPTDVSEEPYILDVQRHPDCPLTDVVTCGECKWYNPWHANHTNIDGNHCRYIDRPMKPTDFCSYGERRSDE